MPAKVVRSPNYPTVSLEEAVGRAHAIYKKEHTHPAAREVLAKALGYGGSNGASASVLSALAKYGLLEPAGTNHFKVSRDALDIILHRTGDPERVTAVRAAAFKPALFAELHAQYGDTPPSEHNLSATLQKRGFNPNTVGGVIRSYRDTLAFVAAETSGYDADIEEEAEPEVPMQAAVPRTEISRGQPPAPAVPTTPGGPLLDGSWGEHLQLRLGDGVTALVAFRGEPTQDAISKLIRLLQVQYDLDPDDVNARRPAVPLQRETNQPGLWDSPEEDGSVG